MHEHYLSEAREQRMVIYPSVWKLLFNALLPFIFVPGFIDFVTGKYGTIHPSNDLVTLVSIVVMLKMIVMLLSILFLCYVGLVLVLSACRLLSRLPTLILDKEGIRMAPSLLSWETIRINWEEIAAIYFRKTPFKTSFAAAFTSLGSSTGLFIAIVPQYEDGVLARQNRMNKTFFRRSQWAVPAGIFIPYLLLPSSRKKFLAQLQSSYQVQIERYTIRIGDDGGSIDAASDR